MKKKHISHFKNQKELELFGIMPDGQEVYCSKLVNKNGLELRIINYGATLQSLKIPLKNGEVVDVVLGFASLKNYLQSFDLHGAPYFGATIGRYAGRIQDGTFVLNGNTFFLNKNNQGNCLHGGNKGFSEAIWQFESINDTGTNPSVSLHYFSPSGEENFPGDLSVTVTYCLTEENEVVVTYQATTTADTVVNLTHHSYFNLDGHTTEITNQELMVNATKVLEIKKDGIPTGRFLNSQGTNLDYKKPSACPERIDTTFVLPQDEVLAACLFSKKNHLKMSVYTNQPGVHIYVGGNCFNRIEGKEGAAYTALSGICFETQNFPDAPNQSHFPDAVLRKSDKYQHTCTYKLEFL
ncbi:aldose epimerase family protein [Flavobacterium crassostreae]|uniref:Aldose 1-epimerase n=1 Tax=Flavobacterium crassostreae TaxID=1763534 RepID=A0A1B9DX84_9FLAO|nr:aldose epimerase family protein [Flavobacterium crassostreae]OCB74289.1 galactose mutarotase [Flavobacterium crassostreae]